MNKPQYFVPPDAYRMEHIPGMACGHGALAAAAGVPIADAMKSLKTDWVNIPQMKLAIEDLTGAPASSLPGWVRPLIDSTRAVCMIQWVGPWCDPGRPAQARCQHRHWVALRGDFVWDVNLPLWVTRETWAKEIPHLLMPPKGVGWEPFRSLVFASRYE